ncbi:MAG TPA: hypothetical protein VGM78_08135 [Ilumatobacteraceae bacterium]
MRRLFLAVIALTVVTSACSSSSHKPGDDLVINGPAQVATTVARSG